MLLFPMPMRELLAQMLNDAMPAADPSWGFIAGHYPGAVVDLIRANGGFVRDGAWYSAAFFAGGLLALFGLARGGEASPSTSFLKAAAVAAVAYVFVVPIFSAFRLELGVRADGRVRAGARPPSASPARVRAARARRS